MAATDRQGGRTLWVGGLFVDDLAEDVDGQPVVPYPALQLRKRVWQAVFDCFGAVQEVKYTKDPRTNNMVYSAHVTYQTPDGAQTAYNAMNPNKRSVDEEKKKPKSKRLSAFKAEWPLDHRNKSGGANKAAASNHNSSTSAPTADGGESDGGGWKQQHGKKTGRGQSSFEGDDRRSLHFQRSNKDQLGRKLDDLQRLRSQQQHSVLSPADEKAVCVQIASLEREIERMRRSSKETPNATAHATRNPTTAPVPSSSSSSPSTKQHQNPKNVAAETEMPVVASLLSPESTGGISGDGAKKKEKAEDTKTEEKPFIPAPDRPVLQQPLPSQQQMHPTQEASGINGRPNTGLNKKLLASATAAEFIPTAPAVLPWVSPQHAMPIIPLPPAAMLMMPPMSEMGLGMQLETLRKEEHWLVHRLEQVRSEICKLEALNPPVPPAAAVSGAANDDQSTTVATTDGGESQNSGSTGVQDSPPQKEKGLDSNKRRSKQHQQRQA